MKNVFLNYGTYILIGMPIIMSFLMYSLGMRFTSNKWRSIHTSTQWTAIFYIIAVVLLVKLLFDIRLIGYIVIILILILAITLIAQWKKEIEVELFNGLRMMWRLSFLLFSIVYIGLIIYAMVHYFVL